MCLLSMMMVFHFVLKVCYPVIYHLELFLYYRHTLCKVVVLTHLACKLFYLFFDNRLRLTVAYQHTRKRKYARYDSYDYTFCHVTSPLL